MLLCSCARQEALFVKYATKMKYSFLGTLHWSRDAWTVGHVTTRNVSTLAKCRCARVAHGFWPCSKEPTKKKNARTRLYSSQHVKPHSLTEEQIIFSSHSIKRILLLIHTYPIMNIFYFIT